MPRLSLAERLSSQEDHENFWAVSPTTTGDAPTYMLLPAFGARKLLRPPTESADTPDRSIELLQTVVSLYARIARSCSAALMAPCCLRNWEQAPTVELKAHFG